ncbi:MAG TPA: hypothetical protein VH144_01990 [Candidatus Saccharimonadales bacterium]|nr:hypothetical protein [Candidatus Saccharimonadales bacterium]
MTDEDLLQVTIASGQNFYVYYSREGQHIMGGRLTIYRLWDEALPDALVGSVNKMLDYYFTQFAKGYTFEDKVDKKWFALENESDSIKRAVKALDSHSWLRDELDVGSPFTVCYYLFDKPSLDYEWYPSGKQLTEADEVVSIIPTTRTAARTALRS